MKEEAVESGEWIPYPWEADWASAAASLCG